MRHRLFGFRPCSSHHHKPNLVTGDFVLALEDLHAQQHRENEFVFLQQTSANRFIQQLLESVNNILASILFPWNGFLDSSLEQIDIEL